MTIAADLQQRCADLQDLYAEALAELGQDQPDLARLGQLADRCDRLLSQLPAPADIGALSADQRARLLTAATRAEEMLKRVGAVLVHRRGHLVKAQARAELAAGAARAYRNAKAAREPRFLDQRR